MSMFSRDSLFTAVWVVRHFNYLIYQPTAYTAAAMGLHPHLDHLYTPSCLKDATSVCTSTLKNKPEIVVLLSSSVLIFMEGRTLAVYTWTPS